MYLFRKAWSVAKYILYLVTFLLFVFNLYPHITILGANLKAYQDHIDAIELPASYVEQAEDDAEVDVVLFRPIIKDGRIHYQSLTRGCSDFVDHTYYQHYLWEHMSGSLTALKVIVTEEEVVSLFVETSTPIHGYPSFSDEHPWMKRVEFSTRVTGDTTFTELETMTHFGPYELMCHNDHGDDHWAHVYLNNDSAYYGDEEFYLPEEEDDDGDDDLLFGDFFTLLRHMPMVWFIEYSTYINVVLLVLSLCSLYASQRTRVPSTYL